MKKRRTVLSSDRDMPMLTFIWRWKLATTAALHARFFSEATRERTYTRLWKLESAGYIESVGVQHLDGHAWALTKRGFAVIREDLPELIAAGFASESPNHDLHSAAFQLGDWIHSRPDHASMFSEQQLRRYHPEMYPEWVPKMSSHRPDGYTLIQEHDRDRLVAFEVELGRKSVSKYHGAGLYYAHQRGIDRVLWLIGRGGFAEHLDRHLTKYDHGRCSIHNFVGLEQFRKRGWQSEFCYGPEAGMTVEEFLGAKNARTSSEESAQTHLALHFLNARKSFVRPRTSSAMPKAEIGHRPHSIGS